MWLKQIELKNFQNHSDLKLNFTSGVNVLYGATDVGKSCVRRAISWVFFNTPQGDVVRKEGTKKTSVKVTLDNDITVERIKSASINAYILAVGDEIKRFDSVGRKIPEEVVEVLRTSLIDINGDSINLNISDQIALPFLMDKSATFRSKLFNKLTGSEITDKILQDLNKDILRVGREEKIISEELEQKEEQKIVLKIETNKLKENSTKLKQQYTKLKNKKTLYNRLSDIREKIKRNIQSQELTKKQLEGSRKDLISTSDLRKNQIRLDKLTILETHLKNNNEVLYRAKNQLSKIKNLSKLPLSKLKSIWEKLNMLNKTRSKLEQKKIEIKNINAKKEEIGKKLVKWVSRYKEELKKRDICPTCKQKITKETLENLKVT